MTPERTWIIGSAADCDLVVAQPVVSARHCRLTRAAAGFLLEDLGSTNGTFVNGYRIQAALPVTREDAITLGRQTPLPWPPAEAEERRVIRIGRAPDNDLVAAFDRISSHHAQLIVDARGITIEDLGSTNGTFVGTTQNRVTRVAVRPEDTVFLASIPFRVESLLAGRAEPLVMAPATMVEAVGPNPQTAAAAPHVSAPHAAAPRGMPDPPVAAAPHVGNGSGGSRLSSFRVSLIAAATAFVLFSAVGIGYALRRPTAEPIADSVPTVDKTGSQAILGTHGAADDRPGATGQPDDDGPPVREPQANSSASSASSENTAAAPTKGAAPGAIPENCVYFVCAASPSDPAAKSETQVYRLGVACAISERHLVTSAAVVISFDLVAHEHPDRTVYCPALGKELAVTKSEVLPQYRQAWSEEQESTAAFEELHAENQAKELSEEEKATVRTRLAELYRKSSAAAQRQVHFDVGVLEVAEPVPHWLPMATDETRLRPKGAVRVVGLAFDLEDPLLDREIPSPLTELPARVLATPWLQDSPGAPLRLVGSCSAEHMSRNWFGSPVLNGQNQLIAIYSRPVPDPSPAKPPPGDRFEGPLARQIAELLPSSK